MRRLRRFRLGWRGGIGLVWIAIWILNLASAGSYRLRDEWALSPALRITVNGRIFIATCPHHPDGCPKDCMCPKTYIEIGRTFDAPPASLQQPYLAACTAHKAFAHDAVSSPLTEPRFHWQLFPMSVRLDCMSAAFTLAGFPLPPLKIPIA